MSLSPSVTCDRRARQRPLLHRRPAPRRRFERPHAPALLRKGDARGPGPVPVAVAPIADVTMRATVWRAATTPVFVPIAATPTVPSPVQPEPSPFELGSWGSGSNETAPAWAGHVPVWLTLVAFAVGVIAGATLI